MQFFGMKATKAFAIGVVLSGLVVGCNEATNPLADASISKTNASVAQSNSQLVQVMKQGAENTQLASLAKAVAATLVENDVAKAVHGQAIRRFDGCTDVLWNNLNTDQNLTNALASSGAGNWSAMVTKNAGKFSLQSADVSATLENYSKKFAANPHLFWYNAEKWDGKTEPLVTFVPILPKGQDIDKMSGEVVAYDAQGKEYIINEAIAKTRPVIVIAPNERTELNGQLKQSVAENLNAPRMSRPKDAASVQNSYLTLNSLSFTDAFEGTWFIEHWILGDPEFYALIHTIGTSNSSFVYQWARWDFTGSITRAQCNGQFFSIFRGQPWNSSVEKTLNFKWFEFDDSNITTELTLGASFKVDNTTINASYKVTIKDTDDILGGMTANVDDGNRTYYSGNPNMFLSW